MVKILRWLVLALLLYLGLTEGIPWVREQIGGVTRDSLRGRDLPSNEGPLRCVHLAEDASASIGVQVRYLAATPGDPVAWEQASVPINNLIRDAEFACACPGAACENARQALAGMDELVRSLDGIMGGRATTGLDLARQQEEINTLLGRARAHADRGPQDPNR